jgi:hypothetical protein
MNAMAHEELYCITTLHAGCIASIYCTGLCTTFRYCQQISSHGHIEQALDRMNILHMGPRGCSA